MEVILINLLFKLGPYVAALLGLVALYLGIKRKGAAEERSRWEEAVHEERARVADAVRTAEKGDVKVDREVNEKLDKLKSDSSARPPVGDDIFRF